jgi:hypothetical protein
MKQVQMVAFLLLALLVPFASSKAADSDDGRKARSPGALMLPIAGTTIDAAGQASGAFSGTLTITRFAGDNGEVMALGFVRGTVTNLSGQVVKSGLQDVVLPVNLGQRTASLAIPPESTPRLVRVSSEAAGGRFILTQAQSCGILHLAIGGNTVDLLGVTVTLSPITLDLSGSSAGPLGALVCQIVALLGTAANVVGLLNSLLGGLTGLVGGLIP